MKQEKIMKVNCLAERIHKGDNKAWSLLYTELEGFKKNMVDHYSFKYQGFNVSSADLEEAFDMALIKSVKNYKFDEDSIEVPPFFYYFQSAANTECKGALRKAQADNRKVMCDYTSFSTPASTNKDGDEVLLGDAIPDKACLEEAVLSRVEVIPQMQQALDLLKQKDADIIRIHLAYPDKKDRKLALQQYLTGVKDATIRKNVQRARERFAKALQEVGYEAC